MRSFASTNNGERLALAVSILDSDPRLFRERPLSLRRAFEIEAGRDRRLLELHISAAVAGLRIGAAVPARGRTHIARQIALRSADRRRGGLRAPARSQKALRPKPSPQAW